MPRAWFQRVSINDPVLRRAGGAAPHAAAGDMLAAQTALAVPTLDFGDTEIDALAVREHPAGAWRETEIRYGTVTEFIVNDAVVYGPDGIVTVGGFVIEETLAHIPLHLLGFDVTGNLLGFPVTKSLGRIERALHVMGGSHANHFHWLLEILPRLQAPPLRPGGAADLLLLPPMRTRAQAGLLDLIRAAAHAHLSMTQASSVQVGRLRYVPNLGGFGFAPHPCLGPIFDALRLALTTQALKTQALTATRPRRKIYVARNDSGNRRLANEDAVIALVQRHGFEAVSLSNTSLESQAAVFSDASHIVAPHGAGLANLMFCQPGTMLCELHMDQYVHWCFRRIAALRALRYGCLIGRSEGEMLGDGWVHHMTWTAPLDRLERLLDAWAGMAP